MAYRNSSRNGFQPVDGAEAANFGEFFDGGEEAAETWEFVDDYDDEDYDDDEALGEWAEVAMPESLAESADWRELYAEGIDVYTAIETVYPELAGAEVADIDAAIAEMTEGMSPEELESFWSNLARGAKKVFRAAAPIIQKAAPIVGTAVGGMFGAPQVGGMVGNLVGTGVGALNRSLGPTRRVRVRRRRPSQRRAMRRPTGYRSRGGYRPRAPRSRNRSRQRRSGGYGAYGVGRSVGRFARNAGGQLAQMMRSPSVQRALRQGAHGAVNGLFGERMTSPEVLIALEAAIQETLESWAEGGDLGGFDIDSADAVERLAELIESDAA